MNKIWLKYVEDDKLEPELKTPIELDCTDDERVLIKRMLDEEGIRREL